MSGSVQYAYGSQNLLKLNVYASDESQMKIRKFSRRRWCSPKYAELGYFTLLFRRGRLRFVQRTNITDVHSWLFSSLNLLFSDVPVAVAVVVFLSYLLSIDDDDAKDEFIMNLYFTVEFRGCLDLLSASIGLRTYSSLLCNTSVQFQKTIWKISLRRYVIPNT